jgi:hypothetical protein
MVRTRFAIAFGSLGSLAIGVFLATLPPAGSSPAGCERDPLAAEAGAATAVGAGAGVPAIVRDRIVMTDGGHRTAYATGTSEEAVPRHVASAVGVGTAYVEDRAGADTLVTVTPDGVARRPGEGELSHPAWSPDGDLAWVVDLGHLEVRPSGGGAVRRIEPPSGSVGVFSPVFTGPSSLVAVVAEAVEDAATDDDVLNDLYHYDLLAGRWSALTAFQADADRWSIIRTPVVGEDGAVLFVRVHGRASATEEPSFELWRVGTEGAARVRGLPGERYLAGVDDGRLLWNVEVDGAWHLIAEGPDGGADLGCGAVMVDPRFELDPDLMPQPPGGGASEDPSEEPVDVHQDELAAAETGRVELAIAIGDFDSEPAAEATARGLGAPGAKVVDHASAPAAVAPGFYAVAVPIPADTDEGLELERFRRAHPDLAERTWIVTLAGGDG